ncbi:TRAP transporter small permease [Alkalicoccobacillus plakortidis]|uniref:TRAP transporter small permease n=1 Tax=Alkalicoccobacillus plakortidis TaxID=444060 RepID=A0ABT0XJZ1_9BACI|nr:TRAP transporter small permease [Alkalicoccobacillus plakortidis]MCM2676216.1 TRAP transporter small permease [Alkalicoccobacillus plakortidis]
MNKIKLLLDKVLSIFSISLFVFLVALVTWQVATRFLFNAPSSFSEELAKYCFVWLALFGGAFVFGEKGHMAIDFIKEKFSEPVQYGLNWMIEIVTIVFTLLVMFVGGLQLVIITWSQTSASLGVPIGFLYSAIPISGLFIILYSIANLYALTGKRSF